MPPMLLGCTKSQATSTCVHAGGFPTAEAGACECHRLDWTIQFHSLPQFSFSQMLMSGQYTVVIKQHKRTFRKNRLRNDIILRWLVDEHERPSEPPPRRWVHSVTQRYKKFRDYCDIHVLNATRQYLHAVTRPR